MQLCTELPLGSAHDLSQDYKLLRTRHANPLNTACRDQSQAVRIHSYLYSWLLRVMDAITLTRELYPCFALGAALDNGNGQSLPTLVI